MAVWMDAPRFARELEQGYPRKSTAKTDSETIEKISFASMMLLRNNTLKEGKRCRAEWRLLKPFFLPRMSRMGADYRGLYPRRSVTVWSHSATGAGQTERFDSMFLANS
jgi:hypothetical protein